MAKKPTVSDANKKTPPQKPVRRYGWKPDVPDIRDLKYRDIKRGIRKLPEKVDLRDAMPPIRDQGDLGSCTAFSIGTCLDYLRRKTNENPQFEPSSLFIYFCERDAEGTVNSDEGAYIRTGIKVVNHIGFCPEQLWPYDLSKWARRPPQKAYDSAQQYKAVRYYRIDNRRLNDLKHCLAGGYPFVFGFSCYSSLEGKGGHIPMPSVNDSFEGGHAIVACGYDDTKQHFILHNSWGEKAGDKGYYYIPYQYVISTELADDFWTIRLINETDGI